MRVCLWQNGANNILDLFAIGIERSGGSVERHDPLAVRHHQMAGVIRGYDCHVVWSGMYNFSDQIIAHCRHNKKPVFVLDHGWMNRGEYYHAGLNGLNGQADFKNENSSPDRFESLGIELKPWREEGKHILLCGQLSGDITLPCDRKEWAKQVIKRVEGLTDLPIVYRPHPGDKNRKPIEGCTFSKSDLETDLSEAACMITHTSNTVINALVEGVPVFTTGKSIAYPIIPDFEDFALFLKKSGIYYGSIIQQSREQFFNNLAYAQWNQDEIEQGIPFRRLMGLYDLKIKVTPEKRKESMDENKAYTINKSNATWFPETRNIDSDFTVLTCTGNRKHLIPQLKKYLDRQTVQPGQWLIIDDGEDKIPPEMIEGADRFFRDRTSESNQKNLIRSMLEVLIFVKYEKVIIMEDDDWYHPQYLEVMSNYLDQYDLAGQKNTYIYNVPAKAWYQSDCKEACTLGRTGFTKAVFNTIQETLPKTRRMPDMAIWLNYEGNKIMLPPDPHLYVGIKGISNNAITKADHDPESSRLKNKDENFEDLRKLIGDEDAEFYINLVG